MSKKYEESSEGFEETSFREVGDDDADSKNSHDEDGNDRLDDADFSVPQDVDLEEGIENKLEEEKSEIDQPWYLKHINAIGAAGVLSFIVGALFSYGVSSIFESKTHSMMHEKMYQLEHVAKQRQHDLRIASERLNNEIEISKAASRHNIELSRQKEYFEAQYLVQSRNLNLASEEIQSCEKTIDTCRKKITELEQIVENSRKDIENLKEENRRKDQEISQLNEKISKNEIQIKEQQTTIEKQKERITTLKETHRIFEYVLHKASPQLASRIINQIHRVQNIDEENQDLTSKGKLKE